MHIVNKSNFNTIVVVFPNNIGCSYLITLCLLNHTVLHYNYLI